ncbi:CDC73-domain-containing protein [Pseudovirgaria hyperparasitica]|uniref:CDC73-domain-containing protein n=1 Tax=Pseudovirgaria hyperparasitica TaxID=470096 RepID=A0A6A6WLE7_9PEZI|nr:CDC73-domain-containing protein [Pseudovirgaria hyperparasitica]KAF2763040.1 CDC73-domain-containing protein [Pseudovirgaria hyperparasitica]
MASFDPLLQLREAIAKGPAPFLTKSSDGTATGDIVASLSEATHLQFNHDNQQRLIPLTTPTRFVVSGNPVDLRNIYLAWIKKDAAIPEYVGEARKLNEELAKSGAVAAVQNLQFVQKLDLVAWLQGASDESEYIKPLAADGEAAQASADVASGAAGGVATVPSAGQAAKGPKQVDSRLLEIYSAERKMGDRNSCLRGIKPTDFSHVRKSAAVFLHHSKQKPGQAPPNAGMAPSLPLNPKKPHRRIEPIILISPSASSLLRMSNVRSFLGEGLYIPPDTANASVNILHIERTLPSIDPARPMRFILVDSSDQFKPDYWSRVVAVFTTGQAWQFKSYKWTQPMELFGHALGIYVGWRGDSTPDTVKGWGRSVATIQLDKWNNTQGTHGRWRDREVMESVWSAIEESMRGKGWAKEGPR